MPSGSHSSGGGGSHFGGGSSGGSHFGGSSRSSGGFIRRSRPGTAVIVLNGKQYEVAGKKRYLVYAFAMMLLIGIFAIFAGVLLFNGAKESISTIKADYDYYQSMAETSNRTADQKIKGVVTDHFKSDNCNKYYIVYFFPLHNIAEEDLYSTFQVDFANNDIDNNWVRGYSYSVYTLEEVSVSDLQIGSVIDLAINCNKASISKNTDSIPMDYLGMPIERDGEYQNAKHSKTTGIVILVASSVFIVISVVGGVLVAKKAKLLTDNENEETTTATTESTKPAQTIPETKQCAYCGATLSKDATKCPNCGGSQL